MIHQSTWHKATLGGIAGFVLVMNLAGCGDISSTTSAARSSANAMATHVDSGLSGGTQDDAAQIGTVGDSEEGSGDTGSGAENVSREYKNALRSAESYIKYSDFSKAKLYDQLTSEYGSKYPADAAQYAIDNVKADWKAEALDAAKAYQKYTPMSDSELYDQLTSEYGSGFTPEEAQYAIDNLDK